MLKNISENKLTIACNKCGETYYADVTGMVLEKTELGEYQNPVFECPHCEGLELFNVNIPADDTEEPVSTGELPIEDEVQRHYVRVLMRLVRKDFIERRKS